MNLSSKRWEGAGLKERAPQLAATESPPSILISKAGLREGAGPPSWGLTATHPQASDWAWSQQPSATEEGGPFRLIEKLSSLKIGYSLNTYYDSGAVWNPSQIFNFKVILITKEIHAHYLKSNIYEQNEQINPL